MEPASSSVGGSGSGLTGLEIRFGTKKKTKPEVTSRVVDSFAGPLPAALLHLGNKEHKVSWRSKVKNDESSVSEMLDIENMANTIVKETSYAESGNDNEMNKVTPRKTWTHTYMLSKSPKAPMFDFMSDDENALSLPSPKMFNGSNQMLSPVKSFVLDIKVLVVPGKTNVDKLMAIKKIFYQIDGFGEALTPSKFFGIIRSTFTSELSLGRAKDMTINEKIMVNNNLRRVNNHSDREVIIKEIPVDLLKSVVEAVFSKFGKIVSIKMQLIGLWQKALVEFEFLEVADLVTARWSVLVRKNSVCVAKAVSRDRFQALLYILLIGMTAHDLSELIEAYDGKTCFIGCNPTSYVYDQCAVICFESKASKLAAIGLVLVFKGVSLYWAGLSLASCAHCKLFGHIAINCSVGRGSGGHGKCVVTSQDRVRLANIYRKKQVPIVRPVSFSEKTWAQVTGGSPSRVVSLGALGVGLILGSNAFSMNLSLSVSPTAIVSDMDLGLALDSTLLSSASSFPNVGKSFVDFSPSSSKVLTAKIGSLKSNMMALEALIRLVLGRLDHLCSGSGFMGAGVAIIINVSLAHHVSKVEEISGQVVFVWLLFKGELSVTVLGLYADASSGARFGQASEVNSLIAKTVNSSNFVILDGDFNENESGKSASFKFCLSLGLVNSFVGHYLADSHTWSNLRGIGKTIDYIFVSGNLSSAVASHQVVSVSDFFNTNHRAVVVSKFKIKNADCAGWAKFKDLCLAKLLSLGEVFSGAEMRGDVNAMWAVLVRTVVDSANATFSRHWFSEFECLRNKHSSRFFGNLLGTNCLVSKWSTLDNAKVHAFKDLVGLRVKSDIVIRHLSLVRRNYRRLKIFESRLAEEASVRKAIEKHIDNFYSDKDSMIRSVLEKPFHKVVLDHLIVDDNLVLLPEEVKLSVDKIMEGWTRKCSVQSDDAFSGVMSATSMGELLSVVGGLPDGKAAGLSGILNELWKHGSEVVLGCLLALFNKCLSVGVVPVLWKKAWVSMIPKSYDWDGVLTNTWPIALIETARKILFKVLSNHISMACSKFNVLRGDNFSVLKDMFTQSPVFAVSSVIEDAIEKDREL
ncbi:hypothetical protein G9A89_019687 [Geosiphon pyriformis]|nr:hypothetical protein G9A89_019687 [Geosiphon pyriformis]